MKTVSERKGKQGGKRCILAYGESTGHHHQFEHEDTATIDRNILTVKTQDKLVHDEHASHVLDPGVAEVTIQREYGLGMQIRRVVD